MHSDDRIFVLERIPGLHTKATSGLTANDLFTGDNKLHAVRDTKSTLWGLKYEKGILPEPFKQQFTNFNTLLKFVTDYYKRRNVSVKEVLE